MAKPKKAKKKEKQIVQKVKPSSKPDVKIEVVKSQDQINEMKDQVFRLRDQMEQKVANCQHKIKELAEEIDNQRVEMAKIIREAQLKIEEKWQEINELKRQTR